MQIAWGIRPRTDALTTSSARCTIVKPSTSTLGRHYNRRSNIVEQRLPFTRAPLGNVQSTLLGYRGGPNSKGSHGTHVAPRCHMTLATCRNTSLFVVLHTQGPCPKRRTHAPPGRSDNGDDAPPLSRDLMSNEPQASRARERFVSPPPRRMCDNASRKLCRMGRRRWNASAFQRLADLMRIVAVQLNTATSACAR